MASGLYAQTDNLYDSAEWQSGVVTNYDVSAQTLFVNCPLPKHVVIRTDTTMTVRFNSPTNPPITVSANTSFDVNFVFFSLFITTTGSTAVKIFMTQ